MHSKHKSIFSFISDRDHILRRFRAVNCNKDAEYSLNNENFVQEAHPMYHQMI